MTSRMPDIPQIVYRYLMLLTIFLLERGFKYLTTKRRENVQACLNLLGLVVLQYLDQGR